MTDTHKAGEREADSVLVSRADLELIDAAMNHLGDVLNGMDAVEAEDEEKTEPGFDAMRRALAQPAAGVAEPVASKDELRDCLQWAVDTIHENRMRINYEPGSPVHLNLKAAQAALRAAPAPNASQPTDAALLAAFNGADTVIDGLHEVLRVAAPTSSPAALTEPTPGMYEAAQAIEIPDGEDGVIRLTTSEVRRVWRAMLASSPADQGWQSIDTAPKDGTEILLTNGKTVAEGQWCDEEPYIREYRDADGRWIDQQESDGFEGWMDWSGGMKPDPTHWMPLPAAPVLAPRDGGEGK